MTCCCWPSRSQIVIYPSALPVAMQRYRVLKAIVSILPECALIRALFSRSQTLQKEPGGSERITKPVTFGAPPLSSSNLLLFDKSTEPVVHLYS